MRISSGNVATTAATADRLQHQARNSLQWAYVISCADKGKADRRRKNDCKTQRLADLDAGKKAPRRRATITVAKMTAMPPPCGVGILCDERAFGFASA